MKNLAFIFLLFPFLVISQSYINGKVFGENIPLVGANIQWINSNIGVATDSNGEFTIKKENISEKKLVISFIGFINDTIEISKSVNNIEINLKSENNLNTINLTEDVEGIYIDKQKAIKTEVITQEELTKAACCDLAGCFETQLSVEPKTTNIITNTKEISILGLSGVYNQLLVDGFPLMSGLNYTYGISAIPGTLIDNIYISQGLASVIQGHEALTGQINIELKEKSEDEKLFLNLYMNSFMAKQANIDYNYKIGNWRSITSFHTTQPGIKIDKNNDNFIDFPLITKYSIYNKWIYSNPTNPLFTIITLRYLNEKRIGGEKNYNEEIKGSTYTYGQIIDYSQPEIHLKSTYKINDNNNLILQSAISKHNQNSFFGSTEYLADQLISYLNIYYKLNWKSHEFNYGLNVKNLKINEKINLNDNYNRTFGGKYSKKENISGLFAENSLNWFDRRLQLISGLRYDFHNIHGAYFTPRFLAKYNITENTTLRTSLGKGWRTINLFSENVKLFGTNRNIIISNNIKPEEAINYGFNLLHAIYLENSELQFIIDGYITDFSNQVYPNYNYSSDEIFLDNLIEASKSKSLQTEFAIELFEKIGAKIAYNYLDVYKTENGHKHRLPFVSKHHVLGTLSIKPQSKSWHFDCNLHWFGKKKLINTSINPNPYNRPSWSEPYSIINLQLTKKIKNLDLYLGAENILNFKQDNPIISWEEPFGEYFNIANVWGPTKGREIYLGIRYSLK